jgi:hypothetical protein
MKDVEENADFTSQLIKEKLSQKQQQDEMDAVPTGSKVVECAVKCEAAEAIKVWYEAQSDEGHTYYWHIETGGKYGVLMSASNWDWLYKYLFWSLFTCLLHTHTLVHAHRVLREMCARLQVAVLVISSEKC